MQACIHTYLHIQAYSICTCSSQCPYDTCLHTGMLMCMFKVVLYAEVYTYTYTHMHTLLHILHKHVQHHGLGSCFVSSWPGGHAMSPARAWPRHEPGPRPGQQRPAPGRAPGSPEAPNYGIQGLYMYLFISIYIYIYICICLYVNTCTYIYANVSRYTHVDTYCTYMPYIRIFAYSFMHISALYDICFGSEGVALSKLWGLCTIWPLGSGVF